MIKCAIVGGSGYMGGELIRLLLSHPKVNLVSVTGNEMAGFSIGRAHPNLTHINMQFNELYEINEAEVIFLALPNGEAMQRIEKFSDKTIIDTSADFRIKEEQEFEKYYKKKHVSFEETHSFCYGLPELFREDIKTSRRISAPGCFATAAILSVFPIIAEGLSSDVIINAVTGSSGSGIKPKGNTNHSFRADSFFAYEMFTHRHIPEIKQALFNKTGYDINLIFQPHSGPFIRGIYATSIIRMNSKIAVEKILKIYSQYYQTEGFIRLIDNVANVKWVLNTHFCDIHIQSDGHTVIITTAIDNLLKGGAAQAVQCFNIMHGFEESMGLTLCASNP